MRLRRYIALGIAALATVLLIAGVATGRIENDFADADPFVWVAIAPGLILMFAWYRSMKSAAKREFEHAACVPGQSVSFSSEFVSKWTVRGALCGAAAMCLMFAIVVLASPPDQPEQWQAVALAVSFAALCAALGSAVRARSVIGDVEAELSDQTHDAFRGAV